MNAMLIRRAVNEDLPALVSLAQACVEDMERSGIRQWDALYPSPAIFAADIEAGAQWVGLSGSDLIGAFAVDRRLDPQWSGLAWSRPDDGAAAIHRVMVHPARRGRGLAVELMARAETQAHAEGAHSLRLDAFAANPASLRLYEKLGYRRTGDAMMRKGLFICFEKVFV